MSRGPAEESARDDNDDARSPFDVLGVPPSAGTREIEREGQRRLAMIAAGVADDSSPAAEHRVRHALDELRDARRRLTHEMLAPSLRVAEVVGPGLEARVATLAETLPRRAPSSYALAEALLWDALEWPPPFVLPQGHEEERRRAFPADRGASAPGKLADALEWGELVAFHPPTTTPKSEKSSKKKG